MTETLSALESSAEQTSVDDVLSTGAGNANGGRAAVTSMTSEHAAPAAAFESKPEMSRADVGAHKTGSLAAPHAPSVFESRPRSSIAHAVAPSSTRNASNSAGSEVHASAGVFESQPSLSLADVSHTNRAGCRAAEAEQLIRAAAEQDYLTPGACVFESQPRMSSAIVGYGTIAQTVDGPSVFENKPSMSTAAVIAERVDNHVARAEAVIQAAAEEDAFIVFESQPSSSTAAVSSKCVVNHVARARAIIQAAAEEEDVSASVFENQPAQSIAAVTSSSKHVVANAVAGVWESSPETSRAEFKATDTSTSLSSRAQEAQALIQAAAQQMETGTFENKPAVSKAAARHGVKAVESSSEYETDGD